ncbi:MAG: hypothetical protein AAFX94_07765, partial [Myxococcota bacterium]
MNTARTFSYFLVAVTCACADATAPTGADLAPASPVSQPALASAGADAEILRGYPAQLRGAGSYHPVGLEMTFQWEQLEGDRVLLSNPQAMEPTFIAPVIEQALVFRLTVDDGRWTTSDEVTRQVVRSPAFIAPTVRAGPDRVASRGEGATLLESDLAEGSSSADWELVQVSASPLLRVAESYRGPTVFRLTDLRDGLRSAPDYLLIYEDTTFGGRTAPSAPLNGLE